MPDNRRMIQNLFAGMQDALFLGDRFARGEFVAFMQPGQFVSPRISEEDTSPDQYALSQISNALVDTSYVMPTDEVSAEDTRHIYRELLGSVDQVYRDVLTQAALPSATVPPNVLLEIEQLRRWLVVAEPNYTLYRERYMDALEAWELEAHSQTPSSSRLKRLADRRDMALRSWNTTGGRPAYERKYGRYLYLSGPEPATLWAELQTQMAAHERQTTADERYFRTPLNPAPGRWLEEGTSWARFERDINDTETYDYSRQTSWSGGIRGGWGLWSFGGGASGSTNLERSTSTVSTVRLGFDYLRVRIDRPWLKPDVFGYRFWTWKKTFGGQLLSDGGNLHVNPPVRPVGRMPVLPQYLIVVKNVTLSAQFSRQERELFEKTVRYRASGGWGPFSVSGSYTESSRSLYTHATFDGVTFKIDHPQVIAKTGILLPKSPDPDLSLPWTGDEWKPTRTQEEFVRAARARDYALATEEDRREDLQAEAEQVRALHLSNTLARLGSTWSAAVEERPDEARKAKR